MSTITTINAVDNITDSRAVINTNFSNLNTDKIEIASTDTLTNKTINSASNTLTVDLATATVTGTTAEFNIALSDGSFSTLAGTETLTNKTIDADGTGNVITNIGFSEMKASTMLYPSYFGWIAGATSSVSADITSNGTVVTITVEKAGGGDFDIMFSTGFVTVDATPALTATLTPGTDTSPTLNYAFIKASAPTVVTVDTAWPTGEEYHPIGTYLVQSAATAQTYGIYKAHNWTDHVWKDNTENGHMDHINSWIRKQPATWESGVACTPTLTPGSPDTLTFATASGTILQLHSHAMPAFDSSTAGTLNTDTFFVVNDNSAAYTVGKDLYNFKSDSNGNAASNNDRISWVIWGVVSENSEDCKIMVNLPGGFYSTDANAIADPSKYANYNIPSDYTGTGFLIAKLTYSYATSGGGTLTLVENVDLRGQTPSTFAGGTAATTTEFIDTTFRIQDDGDATKEIAFQASGITTGTTRTITMPDSDVTLGALEGTAVLSTGEVGAVKFLREDGDGTCSWQVPAGSGDVSKVGTPADSQIGVWTGDGTIEGDTALTFDTSTDTLATGILTTTGAVTATGAVTGSNLSGTNTGDQTYIAPRVSTEASSATPTIDTDAVDAHSITALATAITSMTTNLSGTPTNFQKLIIRILDDGTGRAITWGASFAAKGVALPTTTTASKLLTTGFIYNTVTSKWECVASVEEA